MLKLAIIAAVNRGNCRKCVEFAWKLIDLDDERLMCESFFVTLNLRKFKVIRLQTKIRVGAVSYLNTKPLFYGFEHGMMAEQVEVRIDYPSSIAAMLLENVIDVGLVPVAVIPAMKEHYIISDYCIGLTETWPVCAFLAKCLLIRLKPYCSIIKAAHQMTFLKFL